MTNLTKSCYTVKNASSFKVNQGNGNSLNSSREGYWDYWDSLWPLKDLEGTKENCNASPNLLVPSYYFMGVFLLLFKYTEPICLQAFLLLILLPGCCCPDTLLAHSLTPLLTSVHMCEQKRTCPITLIIHLCFSPECVQLTFHIIHVFLCLLSVFPNKNQGRCRQCLRGRHLLTSLLQAKAQGTRARSGVCSNAS